MKKSSEEQIKETPAEKFLREREEKLAIKQKRDEKRKARENKKRGVKETTSNKPMEMNGSFPTTPAIYKLVNRRTGEVFVSNAKNLSNGVKRHLSSLRNHSHENVDLQEDYDNGDRFYVVVLREFNYYDEKIIYEDKVEFVERENSYRRGYNRHFGGRVNPYANNPNHDPGRRLDGRPSSP